MNMVNFGVLYARVFDIDGKYFKDTFWFDRAYIVQVLTLVTLISCSLLLIRWTETIMIFQRLGIPQ